MMNQKQVTAVLPLALLLVIGAASAASGGAINVDDAAGLGKATGVVCATLTSLADSAFVSMIAIVMFVGGLAMIWLKMRGGMALAITAFLGYFIVKQSMGIAKSLGFAKGCP